MLRSPGRGVSAEKSGKRGQDGGVVGEGRGREGQGGREESFLESITSESVRRNCWLFSGGRERVTSDCQAFDRYSHRE